MNVLVLVRNSVVQYFVRNELGVSSVALRSDPWFVIKLPHAAIAM